MNLIFFSLLIVLLLGFRLPIIYEKYYIILTVFIVFPISLFIVLKADNLFYFAFILILLFSLFCDIYSNTYLSYGMRKTRIKEIEGCLITDSTIDEWNQIRLQINIESVKAKNGDSSSAKGIVYCKGKQNFLLVAGENVTLTGYFNEKYFIIENYQVNSPISIISLIRRNSIRVIDNIFTKNNLNLGVKLAESLILGRCEEENYILDDLANRVGCIHVLALSGMHLFVLAFIVKILFSPLLGKKANIISIIVIIIFIFIVGPKASLIRAGFMFIIKTIFPNIKLKQNLMFTIILQLLFFPYSMISLGATYSFLALSAFSLIYDEVNNIITWAFPNFISTIFSSSICAILFCAPLQLVVDGVWYPIAILISPIAGILAGFSMVNGFFILFSKGAELSIKIAEIIYKIMRSLFVFFQSDGANVYYYLGFFFSLLIVDLTVFFIKKADYRRKKQYELELCLRFTNRNYQFIRRNRS